MSRVLVIAQYHGTPTEIALLEIVLLEAAMSPVRRPLLVTAAHGAGYKHWSGRMVKYVLRRLVLKGEIVADDVTGHFHATTAGQRRLGQAPAAARVRSA